MPATTDAVVAAQPSAGVETSSCSSDIKDVSEPGLGHGAALLTRRRAASKGCRRQQHKTTSRSQSLPASSFRQLPSWRRSCFSIRAPQAGFRISPRSSLRTARDAPLCTPMQCARRARTSSSPFGRPVRCGSGRRFSVGAMGVALSTSACGSEVRITVWYIYQLLRRVRTNHKSSIFDRPPCLCTLLCGRS